MKEKDLRKTSHDILEILMGNYISANASGDSKFMKSVLEEARTMAAVVKQHHQEISLNYKKRELDQKDRDFEYKKNVSDPFEQQKTMAELGLKSRYLDLVEQGKMVGSFKFPSICGDTKTITTSSNEEVVADVTLSEE